MSVLPSSVGTLPAAAAPIGRPGAAVPGLEPVVARILTARREIPARLAVLVAVSGIDGSGKGFVTAALASRLAEAGLRAAVVGVDGWLHLPSVRFGARDPIGHFYRHAIRFEDLFRDLVLPLRRRRSVRLTMDWAEETAHTYRRHRYAFDDVDVVLVEGIFLLKEGLRRHYDLSVWVDCTFQTALERAVARAQEGLGPEETAAAYRRLYFPAQALHIARDDPRSAADMTLVNDPRLERRTVV